MQLHHQYQQRARDFAQIARQMEKRYNQLALLRLLAFVLGVGLFIYLLSWPWYLPSLFLLLFLAGFGGFIRWHQGIKADQLHHQHLATVNESEVRALQHDHGAFDPGSDYTQPEHPYALDLDLFGPHSFFQLANRSATSLGSQKLAEYLNRGATRDEIPRRQTALRELGGKLEWRQHFHAYGLATAAPPAPLQALRKWLGEAAGLLPKRGLPLAFVLAPIWFVLVIYLTYRFFPWQVGLLSIIPQALLLRQFTETINHIHQQTTAAEKILADYARLIQHLEAESFASPKLRELQALLQVDTGESASATVRRLSYIISQLNVRYNAFVVIFNLIGLWDLYWVRRLEIWKTEQREYLPRWFASLEEFAALLSLATVHYNHPDWVFPELGERAELDAEHLGHPLISTEQRVANDFAMPTAGHTKLVTGSNMAGKSTFLRTVGLNIVLAMCGAPVCARRMALPPIQVYTSMRTQDALHESTSSFYAELKRLKVIIEAVDRGKAQHPDQRQPFFLLDEILKGTNSKDRHTGSKALIRQLIQSQGSGLIATHDLELGSLEAQYGGAVENLCMEVEVAGEELVFDCRLKRGVCQRYNAAHLMRNVGSRIEEGK